MEDVSVLHSDTAIKFYNNSGDCEQFLKSLTLASEKKKREREGERKRKEEIVFCFSSFFSPSKLLFSVNSISLSCVDIIIFQADSEETRE